MIERFTRDDRRWIFGFAEQEARDLGHRVLGNDHLILGMLCNARAPLFELLGERGLTLAGARAAASAYRAEHGVGDPAQEAAARYDEDREALRAIGIDLDKVRDAVRGKFGDDLADGWGRRPHGRGDRRRGRGRPGPGDFGPSGFGPGGFGPGGFGPGGRRCGPEEPGAEGEPGERRGGRGRRGTAGFGPGGFGPGSDEEGPWEGGRGRRGPRGRGGRMRFGSDARSALRGAVDVARERGDHVLTAHHLLIGIIDVADEASRAVLSTATVSVADLRQAVLDSMPAVGADA